MDFLYLDHEENEIFFVKDPLGLNGKGLNITNQLNDLKINFYLYKKNLATNLSQVNQRLI